MVKLALDSGADPSTGLNGLPPLCLAIQKYVSGVGSSEIVVNLVKAGATASDRIKALNWANSQRKERSGSGWDVSLQEWAIQKLRK